MWSGALKVVAVAALVGFLLLSANDVAIKVEPGGLEEMVAFDAARKEILSPTLSGPMLSFLAWLVTETPLRPFFVRFLLNQNGLHEIRQLASKLPHLPPLRYPMYRLSPEELDAYNIQASTGQPPASLEEIAAAFEQMPSYSRSSASTKRYRTALDYSKVYSGKKATPSQVLDQVLAGCESLAHLRMFSSINEELVRAQARESSVRWAAGRPLSLLDGVPVVVKDMVDVEGHHIYDGTATGVKSTRDDIMIQRLKAAGAIILGVTVMTEGGVTPLGYNAHFQGPFNPHDLEYYSGGSSSGSAVAVAAGLAPIGIGFDGGGSIRVPSAMSGIFGLATSFGRIPFAYSGLPSSMIKAGPMTASVVDNILAYNILAQPPDAKHFYRTLYGYSEYPPVRLDGVGETENLKGLRVGVYPELLEDADQDNLQVARKALNELSQKGAEIVNISIPRLNVLQLAHGITILSEFALSFDMTFDNPQESKLEANTRISVAMGRTVSSVEMLAANRLRHWALLYMKEHVFNRVDVVFTHTVPIRTPKIPQSAHATGENNNPVVVRLMRNIIIANLLGLPAMAVPIQADSNGLPVSVQIIGDHWMEHKLLRIAASLEQAFADSRKIPAAFFDPLASFDV